MSLLLQAQTYTVQLGAYRLRPHALEAQKNLSCDATLHLVENLYKLWCGNYSDKRAADTKARMLRKLHPDAFVTSYIWPHTETIEAKSPLKQARLFFREGLYEQALAQYERMLIVSPNDSRIRYEYARTLFRLHLYDASEKEFEKVLLANPPSKIASHIRRLLSIIDKKRSLDRFFGSFTIGYTHDDNVDYKTYAPTTRYGSLTFVNDTNRTASSYTRFETALSHLHRTPDYRLVTTLYLYSEFFGNDAYRTDFLSLTSTFTKEWNELTLSLPLSVGRTWLGGGIENDTLSLSPTLSKKTGAHTDIALGGDLLHLDDRTNQERSQRMYGIRTTLRHRQGEGILKAEMAYRHYLKNGGSRLDISRKSASILAQGLYRLYERIWLKLYFGLQKRRYDEIDPLLGYARKDTRTQIDFTLSRELSSKMSVDIGYTKIHNRSNIAAYSYKKNLYQLNLNYTLK